MYALFQAYWYDAKQMRFMMSWDITQVLVYVCIFIVYIYIYIFIYLFIAV